MDNLAAHKTERVRERIEERGYELLFLSLCSPDFSLIEETFSKIKGLLGRAKARARGRHSRGARGDHGPRCRKLLLSPWLPSAGPMVMKPVEGRETLGGHQSTFHGILDVARDEDRV